MRILRPYGLRMTGKGAWLFFVGRDDSARPNSSPLTGELSGFAGLRGGAERSTAFPLCHSERPLFVILRPQAEASGSLFEGSVTEGD